MLFVLHGCVGAVCQLGKDIEARQAHCGQQCQNECDLQPVAWPSAQCTRQACFFWTAGVGVALPRVLRAPWLHLSCSEVCSGEPSSARLLADSALPPARAPGRPAALLPHFYPFARLASAVNGEVLPDASIASGTLAGCLR